MEVLALAATQAIPSETLSKIAEPPSTPTTAALNDALQCLCASAEQYFAIAAAAAEAALTPSQSTPALVTCELNDKSIDDVVAFLEKSSGVRPRPGSLLGYLFDTMLEGAKEHEKLVARRILLSDVLRTAVEATYLAFAHAAEFKHPDQLTRAVLLGFAARGGNAETVGLTATPQIRALVAAARLQDRAEPGIALLRQVQFSSMEDAPPPPPVDLEVLARLNPHPRDAFIEFFEEEHYYVVHGERLQKSVTALWHEHFEPFDADNTIDKHFDRWCGAKTKKQHVLACLAKDIFAHLDDDMGAITNFIKAEWNWLGQRASSAGTSMHLEIEKCMNQQPFDGRSPEMRYFDEWWMQRDGWKPYRTEWSIHGFGIAGQIDCVMTQGDGDDKTYIMCDWKRCKEPLGAEEIWRLGEGPCWDLTDDDLGHYCVQQNLYTRILAEFYGVHISEMYLAQFHPNGTQEFVRVKRKQRMAAAILMNHDARHTPVSFDEPPDECCIDESRARLAYPVRHTESAPGDAWAEYLSWTTAAPSDDEEKKQVDNKASEKTKRKRDEVDDEDD